MTDPLDPYADTAPHDVVPRRPGRPSKAIVARLLASEGQSVTIRQPHVTEDVDGIPSGVEVTETTAVLVVSLEALGWTQAEYDDPNITE